MISSSFQNPFFSEEKNQDSISSDFLMLFSRLQSAHQLNVRQTSTFAKPNFIPFEAPQYFNKRPVAVINKNHGNSYMPPFANQQSAVHSHNNPQFQSGNSKECAKRVGVNEKLAATGNIFKKRENWSIINKLPIEKQNTIHIRLEDEGPYGNDEIRYFVLSHLSQLGVQKVNCLFCDCDMPVYDRFPLVDGTLFASPYHYAKKPIPVYVSEKHQFIHGICLKCLNGSGSKHKIKCKHCNESWQKLTNRQIQIGTFYKYDLFAAYPCCQSRVKCNTCHTQLTDLKTGGLPFFSLYSENSKCPQCFTDDYHFIKQLDEIFLKKNKTINFNFKSF